MADDARDRFLGKASKRGVGTLKGYGQASPLSEAVSGFVGAPRRFSVMDPQAAEMQQARDLGEQASVALQLYGALTPFAAAATMAKAGQMGGISPLTAYHGSPHKFKKFDASKIGTGEGAQRYGHGLYFAENPNVAGQYKASASANMYDTSKGVIRSSDLADELFKQSGNIPENLKSAYLAKANEVVRDLIMGKSSSEISQQIRASKYGRTYNSLADAIDNLSPKSASGQMYTVDIPDEKIARMLDWDKPLSQQPKAVQDAFQNSEFAFRDVAYDLYKRKDPLGSDLAKSVLDPEEFADHMRSLGVPGIKYLDQVSRNKPLKDIKREFLNELPEDASSDEVVELLGTGTFSPKNEAIIKELAANDWLGFDYPAQSLSAVLSPSARNYYDLSPPLMRAINEAQEGGTRNFVVFPGEEGALKILDVYAKGGAVRMQEGGKMDMSKVPPLQQERARFIPTASQLREAFERGPLAVARSAKRTFLSGGLPADILRAYGEASVPLNQAITAALGAPIENLRSPPKVDELSEAGTFIPIGDRYRETFGEILGDPLNFIPSAGTVKALGQAGKALGAAGLRKLDEAMLEGTGPLALAVRPVAPVAAASRFPKSSPPTVRPKINEIAPPTRAEMLNELAQKGEPAAVSELARIFGPEEIKVQPEMPVASPVVASAQAIEQVDQPIVMAGGPSIRPEQLDQPVADVIRRGRPIEPMTQPPTLDEVAAARSDSRTSAAIVAERLPIIVPEAERVLGGVYTPGRPDGGKWSDLTTEQLNKRGPGFKFTDNDLEKLWNESLSEVSEAAKQAVQKTGATWRGFTAEDFNIAFSLPLRHQLWYELSGEAFVDRLPDLNLRESLILLDLVGATSARAKPGENLERSLAILSQRMRGVPIDVDITIPSTVAQALRRDGSNISSDLANKTGMFADTIALTGGIPVRFPISVNDVWEARTYGITDEALSANQPLHEMFAKYQNKVRDLVNQSGTFEFPLQSWNVQSRKWVKQRFDDEGIDVFGPESLKGSDYSVEFDKIVKKLENAGINVPDGKITREVLMDPRTADALRPATPRFRDAPKATVEVGTILTPSGKEGYEIYQAAKTIGDVLTQDEYRGVLTSILYDSARGKPTPWEALVRVATDRAQPVTRIYSPTRDDPFSISGTFEGAAGPNIRVPLADMTPDQISYFNAVAGLGLKQKAMAAAEIKRVDPNSEFPQDAIPTSSVRFDYFSKVPETMLTDFTNALGKGFEISVMKYPDGLVFDINPRFTDAGPEGPTAQQIDQAVAVLQRKYNVQNLEVFPTAYRSEYGKNYVEDDGTGATYRAIIDDTLKGWNNGYAEAIQQVAGSRATRQDIEAFLEGRIDKLPLQVSEAGATSAEKSSILGKANTIRKAARQRASDHAAAVKAFEDIGLAVDRKMAEAIPRWKKRAERIAAQEAKKKPPQTPGMARGGAVRISQYRPYLLHHKFDEEFAAGGAVKPRTSEFEGMNFYDILFSR